MIPFVIDIETRPRYMTPAELFENAKTSSLNRCRKPDTIEQWARDPANQLDAWCALSTHPTKARIVAIAVRTPSHAWSWSNWYDERANLEALDHVLTGNSVKWIGHNILDFDLPHLLRAAQRHRMPSLGKAIPTNRYASNIHDTLAGAQGTGRGTSGLTCDSVARDGLCLPGKERHGELDFAELYKWAATHPDLVADAAARLEARAQEDVAVEYAIWERQTWRYIEEEG